MEDLAKCDHLNKRRGLRCFFDLRPPVDPARRLIPDFLDAQNIFHATP